MTRFGVFVLMPKHYDERAAQMELVYDKTEFAHCKECGAPNWHTSTALTMQRSYDRWNDNMGPIVDFTWLGGMSIPAVRDEVRQCLQNYTSVLRFERVAVCLNPRWARKASRKAKTDPAGTHDLDTLLWRVLGTVTCRLDLEQSRKRIVRKCSLCGHTEYERLPGARNVINVSTWRGEPFFHIGEIGLPLFVSDAGRDYLREAKFSNLRTVATGYGDIEN